MNGVDNYDRGTMYKELAPSDISLQECTNLVMEDPFCAGTVYYQNAGRHGDGCGCYSLEGEGISSFKLIANI